MIEVFSDFNPELEKIWCEFGTKALGTLFQSYAWLSHWQSSIGYPLHSVKPQVVLVKAKEKVMAIFLVGCSLSRKSSTDIPTKTKPIMEIIK